MTLDYNSLLCVIDPRIDLGVKIHIANLNMEIESAYGYKG